VNTFKLDNVQYLYLFFNQQGSGGWGAGAKRKIRKKKNTGKKKIRKKIRKKKILTIYAAGRTQPGKQMSRIH